MPNFYNFLQDGLSYSFDDVFVPSEPFRQGNLFTWGSNTPGQLGDNTVVTRSTPVTTLAGGANWKQVSCAGLYTAAIKTDGTLWTWGRNIEGQLGDNTNTNRSTPVTTFAGGTNWKQVTGGYYHTAAIKTDGTLWTWGTNIRGSIGNNTSVTRSTPVTTFAGGTNWKQVACGTLHTAAIKTDGTLWTWGNEGTLGAPTSPIITASVTGSIPFTGSVFTTSNTSGVQIGDSVVSASPPDSALISSIGTVITISTNTSITFSGNNFSSNPYTGTLNLGISARLTPITTFAGGNNWKQVACGADHTAAIKTDGTLWTWGINSSGQLGDNTVVTRSTPVTTLAGGANWKQVAGGSAHTIAIKTDGTLWIWGSNSQGQLGDNTVVNRSTPVTTFAGGTNWKQVYASSGSTHTAAIKTDGTLWTWGRNNSGQLGTNNTTNRSTPVTTFAGGTNWKQVACATQHTAAITYIDDYQ